MGYETSQETWLETRYQSITSNGCLNHESLPHPDINRTKNNAKQK
jgi:hypothetical protein